MSGREKGHLILARLALGQAKGRKLTKDKLGQTFRLKKIQISPLTLFAFPTAKVG